MSNTLVRTRGGAAPAAEEREEARPVVEFIDAVNRGDVDGAVAQLAPDALHHGRVSSYRPEGVRVLFGMLRGVFPDLRLDIRELTVEGNRVVSRIVGTGTHTGSFLGKPPTGHPMVWESLDIAEVGTANEGGNQLIIGRCWDIWGDPALWKKIGFTPAMVC